MDARRFDDLARLLAHGATTRRGMLRIAGAAVAGAGWLRLSKRAAAQCAGEKVPCQADAECCAGLVCCGGVCVSPEAFRFDPFNCGGCGVVCESGICDGGQCLPVAGCDPGLTDCGGVCVDLAGDAKNCGGCGIVCPSGVCQGGQCAPAGCESGLVDCGGVCIDVSSDPKNCGGCGIVCESGTCEGGTCQAPPGCAPGLADCGVCADLTSDPKNCGECGVVCPGEQCDGGACVPPNEPTVTPTTETTVTPGSEACIVEEGAGTTHRSLAVRSPDGRLTLDLFINEKRSQIPVAQLQGVDLVAMVSAGQRDLLTSVATIAASGAFEATVRYGDLFRGIQQATVTSEDGKTAVAVIDGRRTPPFAVGADPTSVTFEDGSPLPQVSVDNRFEASLKDLTGRAQQAIAACFAAEGQSAGGAAVLSSIGGSGGWAPSGGQAPLVVPDPGAGKGPSLYQTGGAACRNCIARCDSQTVECYAGMAVSCFFVWFLCAIPTWPCGYNRRECLEGPFGCNHEGEACCPLRCPAGYCCEAGATCFVARTTGSTAGCCPSGRVVADGVCCAPGEVNDVCPGLCCPAGSSCVDGSCCPPSRTACGSVCCGANEVCDPNQMVCCPRASRACPGGACCPASRTCTPEGACCEQGATSCGGVCCGPGGECVSGSCCDPPSLCGPEGRRTCCLGTMDAHGEYGPGQCCNGVCVGAGYDRECIDDRFCPSAQACGTICCEGAQVCEDPVDKRCGPCPEGSVPCLVGTGCCSTTVGGG